MTELDCLAPAGSPACTAHVVERTGWEDWRGAQPDSRRSWLDASGFEGRPGSAVLLPAATGDSEAVLVAGEADQPWDGAALHGALRGGTWRLSAGRQGDLTLGWALAAYRFDRYKKMDRPAPLLVAGDGAEVQRARLLARSFYLARDLINTPANDLGPAELAAAVQQVANGFGARCRTIVGDDLIGAGYPLIHFVGQASSREPRLIELVWGEADAPKLTLVGKGVCFDTGGLDLKPSAGMLLMKKDMGGAALMLALARFVMASGLKVRLRLLIPAVENSVSGNAFRPGDIVRSRKGLTVEIGNTDAEGRLVLADALADADVEKPELLLDAATLTGAARVALGTEIPGLFTPDDALAADLASHAERLADPLWRLPLYAPYRKLIDSPIADINNAGSKPFAGSITAALFLKEFVTETKSWAHLDIYALNDEARPGRPRGGEATALRALAALVEQRFGG